MNNSELLALCEEVIPKLEDALHSNGGLYIVGLFQPILKAQIGLLEIKVLLQMQALREESKLVQEKYLNNHIR